MPIAVRYTQDAFSRSGWLWPVDAKGEPLKATSYMAVGFYVAKYVNKKRSEERFSRNAETDLVCRLLLEKKKIKTYGWRDMLVSIERSDVSTVAGYRSAR